MIIEDLEHLEAVNEATSIQGGIDLTSLVSANGMVAGGANAAGLLESLSVSTNSLVTLSNSALSSAIGQFSAQGIAFGSGSSYAGAYLSAQTSFVQPAV